MRLFVAFHLPAVVRRAVGERMLAMGERLPAARWVGRENLHLTLVFLGEVGDERRPALEAALTRPFAAAAPFMLRLAGAGTFPRERPARVAWVGVEIDRGLEALRRLQAAVTEAAAAAAGVEVDRRPYTPHLTVARPQRPWRREVCEAFAVAFRGPFGEAFRAAAGHLVASELGKGAGGGPRYTTLADFPLEAAA